MPRIRLERKILKILKIPVTEDDVDFFKEIIKRYPGLDYLDEAKKMMAWLRDHPRIKNKKPRLRFRNWCRIAWERMAAPPRFSEREEQINYKETQKLLSEIRKKLADKFKFKK